MKISFNKVSRHKLSIGEFVEEHSCSSPSDLFGEMSLQDLNNQETRAGYELILVLQNVARYDDMAREKVPLYILEKAQEAFRDEVYDSSFICSAYEYLSGKKIQGPGNSYSEDESNSSGLFSKRIELLPSSQLKYSVDLSPGCYQVKMISYGYRYKKYEMRIIDSERNLLINFMGDREKHEKLTLDEEKTIEIEFENTDLNYKKDLKFSIKLLK